MQQRPSGLTQLLLCGRATLLVRGAHWRRRRGRRWRRWPCEHPTSIDAERKHSELKQSASWRRILSRAEAILLEGFISYFTAYRDFNVCESAHEPFCVVCELVSRPPFVHRSKPKIISNQLSRTLIKRLVSMLDHMHQPTAFDSCCCDCGGCSWRIAISHIAIAAETCTLSERSRPTCGISTHASTSPRRVPARPRLRRPAARSCAHRHPACRYLGRVVLELYAAPRLLERDDAPAAHDARAGSAQGLPVSPLRWAASPRHPC